MIPNKPRQGTLVRYADADYWEERYNRSNSVFEWFLGFTALRRILRSYIPKRKLCLHVGCGTSNLQEGMAKIGYTVVNVRPSCSCTHLTRPAVLRLLMSFFPADGHQYTRNISTKNQACWNLKPFLPGVRL